MKNIYKIKYLLTAILIVISTTSCKDFLDINTDPNNPTDPVYDYLLTSAQVDIAGAMGTSVGGLSGITSAYMHQMFQRGITMGDYGVNGQRFAISTPWNILYTRSGMDLEEIINQGGEQEFWNHVGIAQILKAYTFSILVDIYGDVPYSQAYGGLVNSNPEYDDGAEVYASLFTLLDEAVSNLQKDAVEVNPASDLFYGGDVDNWIKLANSIKLKMYNQVRLVQDVSSEVTTLLASPDMLINSAANDFQFNYSDADNPENRNPGYAQEYNPGGSFYYINPFFYETLRAKDGTTLPSGTYTHSSYGATIGAQDPRLDYYFYNQLPAGSGDGDAENPCSYCPSHSGTSFLSIFMFSFNIDPNEGFDQGSSQTLAGLYPLGGAYDPTGVGGAGDYDIGTPSVPQRLLTYYAQLYTIAELQLEGITAGDARTTFIQAMEASFAKVNEIAGIAGVGTISDADRDTYINAVLADYDAGDNARKLENIMTQKWIASYGFGVDAYTDYRRTGYPILPTGDDGLGITVQTRDFPYSMPWPTRNLDLNTNAPNQKQIATNAAKVFWDL